ncbi:uncharacterized protein LDX57_007545 [Aspergillus melleus]|uniref:uncharacterized protein n=1 Tax=Aspergillus melleus TaxID=138277 RepID=UPI001E8E2505|nr:uncharacterized protein LDX57_007545 [Aspergillus melleus]KAH8429872.1 hypothetical protein LDX57_007545 [Aspergillus melleus]
MDAICQFLTASGAICQVAWAIHETDERRRLKGECDLADLSIGLRHTIQLLPDTAAAITDKHKTLVETCLKLGRNLLIRLDRADESVHTIHNPGPRLRDIWTQDVIEAFALRLVGLIRQHQSINPPSDVLTQYERVLSSFRHNAPRKQQSNSNEEIQARRSSQRESQSSTGNFSSLPESLAIDVRVLKSNRPSQSLNAPVGLLNEFILDTLAYKEMFDREASVVKAHVKTFDWIFSENCHQGQTEKDFRHGLSAWLKTNDCNPIYWMSGKPGSGTLPVLTAGFFSWASGSQEQRSKRGLFRSLLYQLLRLNHDLIPCTFPNLWAKIRTMTSKERIALHLEWDKDELQEAFHLYMKSSLSKMKFCLFIDGLDEFEEGHRELIIFFKELSLNSNVKICLSSRPWTTIEEAFQSIGPNAKIQDITKNDLHQYATDRLRENVVVRRCLGRENLRTKELLQAIVDRASGVFLWIKLALDDILKGFAPEKGISGLMEKVDQLPAELDGLYEKLLFQDQTDIQIARTATFLFLIESREIAAEFVNDTSACALTVWELAFALEEDDDYATDGVVSQVSDKFILERCSRTVECMHQRFAGLLSLQGRQTQDRPRTLKFTDSIEIDSASVRQLADNKVTFIHRTVRDWLRDDHVHRRLEQRAEAGFDPNLRLLQSYVLRLKKPMDEIEHHRRFDEWWPDVTLAMTHSRYIKNDVKKMQRYFLNQLNDIISWLWDTKPDIYDHWAAKAFGFFHVRKKAPPIWHPFLCLATKFGLTTYVSEELDACISQDRYGVLEKEMPTVDDKATPLLTYATEFLCSRQQTIYPLSDPHMVRNLLARSHRINPGPNHEYIDFETKIPMTSWVNLLRLLREAHRRGMIGYFDIDTNGIGRWTEIVRLFVEGGANVNAVVAADSWDSEISTAGVIELLADTYCDPKLEELKHLLDKIYNRRCERDQ